MACKDWLGQIKRQRRASSYNLHRPTLGARVLEAKVVGRLLALVLVQVLRSLLLGARDREKRPERTSRVIASRRTPSSAKHTASRCPAGHHAEGPRMSSRRRQRAGGRRRDARERKTTRRARARSRGCSAQRRWALLTSTTGRPRTCGGDRPRGVPAHDCGAARTRVGRCSCPKTSCCAPDAART